MVATDTVVGIVGAVLLVAVMAGVFVYEYNNPAEAEDLTPEGRMAAFEGQYEGMSATDDVDGDDTPNYEDDDLDGDGTPNANDTATATAFSMNGQLGPAGTAVSMPIYAGNGTVHIMATVTAALAVPNPLVSGNLIIQLVNPDGSVVADATITPGSG